MSRIEPLPKGPEPRSAFPVKDPLQPDSPRDSMVPTLLTVPQVASLLNVSRSAVYHLAARRRLTHVKAGTTLRFRPGDALRFISDNLVESRTNDNGI